jgi:hypothetical protein
MIHMSSRRLSQGSILQRAPALGDVWIPGTSPGMTIVGEHQ